MSNASSGATKWPVVPPEVEEKFNELALDQRSVPEAAMIDIQNAMISQLYGFMAEHVGDLIHRMSQKVNWFHGGYEWVSEKVEKTLRRLRHPYGFWRESQEQIHRNIEYFGSHGRDFFSDFETALAELKRLGQAYADAHRALTPYNEAQAAARDAAIAIGEFRFDDAQQALEWLEAHLANGPYGWARKAMEY